jgi:hypothetical protein
MHGRTFKSRKLLGAAIFLMLALFLAATVLPAAMGRGADPEVTLTREMRDGVIDSLDVALKSYVYPEKAKAASALLRSRQQDGAFNAITDPGVFAQRLTQTLQERTDNDQHIRVMFSPEAGAPAKQPWLNWLTDDAGVPEVDRLPGNIGYIKIDSFLPPELAGRRYESVMESLGDTSALILDLREAGQGGDPYGVALFSSYFFDKRTHLNDIYWRERDETTHFWTDEKVSGRRYGSTRPVYILTSHATFSACEEFVYNMQQLKRATVIGEPTRGGAHPGRATRLTGQFKAVVPSGRAVNPVSGTNWEGKGVVPDRATTADQALKVAQEEILKRRTKAVSLR